MKHIHCRKRLYLHVSSRRCCHQNNSYATSLFHCRNNEQKMLLHNKFPGDKGPIPSPLFCPTSDGKSRTESSSLSLLTCSNPGTSILSDLTVHVIKVLKSLGENSVSLSLLSTGHHQIGTLVRGESSSWTWPCQLSYVKGTIRIHFVVFQLCS